MAVVIENSDSTGDVATDIAEEILRRIMQNRGSENEVLEKNCMSVKS